MSESNIDIEKLARTYQDLKIVFAIFLLIVFYWVIIETLSVVVPALIGEGESVGNFVESTVENVMPKIQLIAVFAWSICAYRLGAALGSKYKILWAIAMWLPLINFIAHFSLNARARDACEAAGISVGLLGQKQLESVVDPSLDDRAT